MGSRSLIGKSKEKLPLKRQSHQPKTQAVKDGKGQRQSAPAIQRGELDPHSLNTNDLVQLQLTYGNRAVNRILSRRQIEQVSGLEGNVGSGHRTTVQDSYRVNGAGESGKPAQMVQRYKTLNAADYAMHGTAGDEMFSSQSMDLGQGRSNRYRRTRKTLTAGGGLEGQGQSYDPAAGGGAGQWVDDPGGPVAAAMPNLKISENGKIAIDATAAQPKTFFIDLTLMAQSNARLARNTNTKHVQLVATGPSITFDRGRGPLRRTRTLQQVTIQIVQTSTGNATTMAADVCDQVSKHVATNATSPTGWASNAKVVPQAGQSYTILSDSDLLLQWANNQLFSVAPDPGGAPDELNALLNQLDVMEAQIDNGINVAMAAFGPKVKALYPVWRDHYEGVVAKDGNDTVTFVNYNRKTEFNWVKRRIFNEYYRNSAAFRNRVRAEIPNIIAQLEVSKGAKGWTAENVREEYGTADTITLKFYQELSTDYLQSLLGGLDAAGQTLANQLQDAQQALNTLKNEMWYFEMYGKGAQSFHTKYSKMTARPTTKRGG